MGRTRLNIVLIFRCESLQVAFTKIWNECTTILGFSILPHVLYIPCRLSRILHPKIHVLTLFIRPTIIRSRQCGPRAVRGDLGSLKPSTWLRVTSGSSSAASWSSPKRRVIQAPQNLFANTRQGFVYQSTLWGIIFFLWCLAWQLVRTMHCWNFQRLTSLVIRRRLSEDLTTPYSVVWIRFKINLREGRKWDIARLWQG